MTPPLSPSEGIARASTILDSTSARPRPSSDEQDAIYEKLRDALTPGFAAELDPAEAERAGAFEEDALSEADAMGSSDDLTDALPGVQGDRATPPDFVGDGRGLAAPAKINTEGARRALRPLTPSETDNDVQEG